jgi:pimeloyl-ACP methyl ester carboxylesterase
MEQREFATPYGPIVLWGEAAAFESARPLVLTIAGAFAIEKGPLFRMAPLLAEQADVLSGHLPGNHAPPLISASVGTYAAAYSHVLNTRFAHRPVITCGASIGGLVTLALGARPIRRSLVVEPVLRADKVWPMVAFMRQKLKEAPKDADLRAFITNVFGVTETTVQLRDYGFWLEALQTPTHVLLGDQPLYPERPVDKLPSLVDEPEREKLAQHPRVRVTVTPGAGHNVLEQASAAFVAALRETVAEALA